MVWPSSFCWLQVRQQFFYSRDRDDYLGRGHVVCSLIWHLILAGELIRGAFSAFTERLFVNWLFSTSAFSLGSVISRPWDFRAGIPTEVERWCFTYVQNPFRQGLEFSPWSSPNRPPTYCQYERRNCFWISLPGLLTSFSSSSLPLFFISLYLLFF